MPCRVYLDNHATTPLDPRVVEAMLPYFHQKFGNAGSVNHAYGEDAADAVDEARTIVAAAIGAEPREIVFTSGATESNNLALRGVCERQPRRGNHIVSVATEHRAVLDPLARLGRRGLEITLLEVRPADRADSGLIDMDRFVDNLRDDTLLASVMLANNEIGAIQPLEAFSTLCRERGAVLHTDAAQALGKIPMNVDSLGVDLMSLSAHKLYGPKGVGALYVRRGVRLEPLLHGGGQEFGLRSGTLNVPGIVGFAAAVEIAVREMAGEAERIGRLRGRLYQRLHAQVEGMFLNGPMWGDAKRCGEDGRLPGNLNISFAGVDGEVLMMSLPGLAVSSGSACTTADPEPSHVLRALGRGEELTRASLRFGVGRFNSQDEIDFAVELVAEAVGKLRGGMSRRATL